MGNGDDLPTRTLGRSAITTTALGIGCWAIGGPALNLGLPMGWSNVDDDASVAGLRVAYRRGVRLFDTADVYGHGRSERLLGRLVAEVPRDSLVLVSKVGYYSPDRVHRFDPLNIRRQVRRSLENLGTDYLDVYMLHNENFGDDDEYLEPAVSTMLELRTQGLVRAVGIRGPHRFAADRIDATARRRRDKMARFKHLFELIEPDVIAVRDNLLTPDERTRGILDLAESHGCGVLINKPLGQGLLTGTYGHHEPRAFGDGDHRCRKRWFGREAHPVLGEAMTQLREIVGDDPADLIAVALWSCLRRSPTAAVLAGFTAPWQVAMNIDALSRRPSEQAITAAREVMAAAQHRLDALGEVFTDEAATAGRS